MLDITDSKVIENYREFAIRISASYTSSGKFL